MSSVGLFTPESRRRILQHLPAADRFRRHVLRMFRGVPIAYWAMDLNPDQLIAIGKFKPTDPAGPYSRSANRMILRRRPSSSCWIVSWPIGWDRRESEARAKRWWSFRPGRMRSTFIAARMPPRANPFRKQHGLDGKFVVMYSGNHSPSNPLARCSTRPSDCKDDPDIRFFFVGGGTGKKEVEAVIAENLTNALSLPYQPLVGAAIFPVRRRRARGFAGDGHGRDHPSLQGLRRDGGRPADALLRSAAITRHGPSGRK